MGISPRLDISPQHHTLLLNILQQFLPDVVIWAFGSRVKGTARTTSDLDLVAFVPDTQISQIQDTREALAESNLPFRVDLLVWNELPPTFQHNILQCYYPLTATSPN